MILGDHQYLDTYYTLGWIWPFCHPYPRILAIVQLVIGGKTVVKGRTTEFQVVPLLLYQALSSDMVSNSQ